MMTTTAQALIQRARSALLHPAMYFPGKGGHDPHSATPQGADQVDLGQDIQDPRIARYRKIARELGYDPDTLGPKPACDCSGFLWWVLGEARDDRNTDWIHHDATHAKRRFRFVSDDPGFLAAPGDVLVYPKPPASDFGHVALITQVVDDTQPLSPATRIIHCAGDHMALPPGPGRSERSGFAETGVEHFTAHHEVLVCRPWRLW